jgi:predicted nucleic acid-binding protein
VLSSELALIDTSVWVRYLRRDPDPDLVRQVRAWLDAGQAATTEVIKLELLPACRTETEYLRLNATLDALHLLTSSASIWISAARNGFILHRAGVIVPATDLLIATVAQQYGAQVAHADHHYELMAPHLTIRTARVF